MRDTVRKTSLAGRPQLLTSRGMSSWPYCVTTKYSYCIPLLCTQHNTTSSNRYLYHWSAHLKTTIIQHMCSFLTWLAVNKTHISWVRYHFSCAYVTIVMSHNASIIQHVLIVSLSPREVISVLYIPLTHQGQDKMASISQATYLNAFTWMKIIVSLFNST